MNITSAGLVDREFVLYSKAQGFPRGAVGEEPRESREGQEGPSEASRIPREAHRRLREPA
eukprot:2316132-Karenia_brevis.AAC.1